MYLSFTTLRFFPEVVSLGSYRILSNSMRFPVEIFTLHSLHCFSKTSQNPTRVDHRTLVIEQERGLIVKGFIITAQGVVFVGFDLPRRSGIVSAILVDKGSISFVANEGSKRCLCRGSTAQQEFPSFSRVATR